MDFYLKKVKGANRPKNKLTPACSAEVRVFSLMMFYLFL